ncbi:hypothetical protein EBU24_01600 [bacterium]|nr:hypothetical protein [bacterium]
MKKYTIILTLLVLIINQTISSERPEITTRIEQRQLAYYQAPPAYQEIDTYREIDSSQVSARELPTTQFIAQHDGISSIIYNEELESFLVCTGSKLYSTHNENNSLKRLPTISSSHIFDYKQQEGYLCSHNNEVQIIKEYDSEIKTTEFKTTPSGNTKAFCTDAIFNPYFPEECFVATSQGDVFLWNYQYNLIELKRQFVHEKKLKNPLISFSKNNNLLLAQTALNAAKLFDQRSKKPITIFKTTNNLNALTFNNDDIAFTTIKDNNFPVACIDQRILKPYYKSTTGHPSYHLDFHPTEGNKKLLVSDNSGALFCVNTLNGSYTNLKGHNDPINFAKWSTAGHALSASNDRTAIIWNINAINNTSPETAYAPFMFSPDQSPEEMLPVDFYNINDDQVPEYHN